MCGSYILIFLLFFQVTKETHMYSGKIEEREEGGTPEIIGCIRAAIAFQLKQVNIGLP